MMFRRIDIILFPVFTVLVLVYPSVESLDCPTGQFKVDEQGTNQTRCCKPVFNCPKDHQIIRCAQSGGTDQCEPCPVRHVNYHITSSADWSVERYRCFEKDTPANRDCSPEDHLFFSEPAENCALSCECNIFACYYGNQCGCTKASVCDVGQELDQSTGECVACGPHRYKDEIGCQPCLWNETSWRMSLNLRVEPTVGTPAGAEKEKDTTTNTGTIVTSDDKYKISKDPKDPKSSKTNQDGEDRGVAVVAIAIIIAVLVLVAIIVAVVLVIKRKINNGDQNSRLVVCYNKLTGKNGQQSVAQTDPEVGQTKEEVNDADPSKPQLAVSPIPQKPIEQQEEEIPYSEMSLTVAVNGQNDSCVPLMSAETNGAAAGDSTEQKTT